MKDFNWESFIGCVIIGAAVSVSFYSQYPEAWWAPPIIGVAASMMRAK